MVATYLFRFLIRVYWLIAPDVIRKRCIFVESCSHVVDRTLQESGFKAGMRAFAIRHTQCRPGYQLGWKDGQPGLQFADGSWAAGQEIRPEILQPIKDAVSQCEERIQKDIGLGGR